MTTPPWQVDAWNLSASFDKIEQQWAALRELLKTPGLYELSDKGISAWSCGQHAGHIVLVNLAIAKGIEENLREPHRNADAVWSEIAGAILETGDFRRGSVKTPPAMEPLTQNRDDFVGLLSASVAAWNALRERESLIAGCRGRFPHFALGYMTSSEWTRFCALHAAHHLSVVKDIRVASGDSYPFR